MLFAAGYAACFHSALRQAAKASRVDTSDSEVVADVSLGLLDGGGFGLSVELEISLPSVQDEAARQLIEQAHGLCPYSNATRGTIDVVLTLA